MNYPLKSVLFVVLAFVTGHSAIAQPTEGGRRVSQLYVAYVDLYGFVRQCADSSFEKLSCRPLSLPSGPNDLSVDYHANYIERLGCIDLYRVSTLSAHEDSWFVAVDDSFNVYRVAGFYPRTTASDPSLAVVDALPVCKGNLWAGHKHVTLSMLEPLVPLWLGTDFPGGHVEAEYLDADGDTLRVKLSLHADESGIKEQSIPKATVVVRIPREGFLTIENNP